jgi:hypothetical protein
MSRSNLLLGFGLIVLAVISRFLPHPPNFAPITAIALFGGVYFSDKRIGMFLPLVIMFLSDLILGLHNTLFFVYGSFMIMSGIGFWLKNNYSAKNVLFTALSGSILFFIITNFGVWLTSGGFYPMNIEGLFACYVAAIPFFQNSLLGDLVFTGAIFGSYEMAKRFVPRLTV